MRDRSILCQGRRPPPTPKQAETRAQAEQVSLVTSASVHWGTTSTRSNIQPWQCHWSALLYLHINKVLFSHFLTLSHLFLCARILSEASQYILCIFVQHWIMILRVEWLMIWMKNSRKFHAKCLVFWIAVSQYIISFYELKQIHFRIQIEGLFSTQKVNKKLM